MADGSIFIDVIYEHLFICRRRHPALPALLTPAPDIRLRRPRWTALNTERRIVRYALTQIEAGAAAPGIRDNGQRIEWRIAEPTVGTKYMCVAFHSTGMLLCNHTLHKISIA